MRRFILAFTLTLSTVAARADQVDPGAWRRTFHARLAICFPGANRGISRKDVARALGVSTALISQNLTRDDHEFSFEQILALAQFCKINLDDLLAADVIDQLPSLDALEEMIRNDPPRRQSLLVKIFVLRLENRLRLRAEHSAQSADAEGFLNRWRAEVRRRLALLVSKRSRFRKHLRLDVKRLAGLLDRNPSLVSQMLNGPQYVSFEAAERLGRHFGVSPYAVLASDLMSQFRSLDEVERLMAAEVGPLRNLMIRLYGHHLAHPTCAPDFSPTATPEQIHAGG